MAHAVSTVFMGLAATRGILPSTETLNACVRVLGAPDPNYSREPALLRSLIVLLSLSMKCLIVP
jgi:hypothetical protein